MTANCVVLGSFEASPPLVVGSCRRGTDPGSVRRGRNDPLGVIDTTGAYGPAVSVLERWISLSHVLLPSSGDR